MGWFCVQVAKLFVEALDYTRNITSSSLFDYYDIKKTAKETTTSKA